MTVVAYRGGLKLDSVLMQTTRVVNIYQDTTLCRWGETSALLTGTAPVLVVQCIDDIPGPQGDLLLLNVGIAHGRLDV